MKTKSIHSAKKLLLISLLCGAASASANAQYLSNGDFESTEGTFQSWTFNGGVSEATQPISGNHSARIVANSGNTGNALNQNLVDPSNSLFAYQLSFDFAVSDPGSASSRSLQLNLRSVPGSDTGNINLRVVRGSAAGIGTVQVFGGTWQTALVDAINFSTEQTGAGFILNSMTIFGDYSETPFYTISVNGVDSANLSSFQTAAPAADATLKQISFQSGNLVAGSWSVVDNVTVTVVPEPATLTLVGVGLLAILGRRRCTC
jgi:hypothetical protein